MKTFQPLSILAVALMLFVPSAYAPPGPLISATKIDQLLVDTNGNAMADSGDTLRYTVTITNAGDLDALGVAFSDALDANTMLVPGSINTSPIAVDDEYPVLGNVQISITAPGVLANDFDPDGVGPALVVSAFQNPSANGGDVTVNTNGSFTYDPPAGFEGADTFTYTVDDGEGSQDTATVSLTVSGMIWFVDDGEPGGGDGRLTAPFNALTGGGSFASDAADGPGDNIFLYSGVYAGGLTLLDAQKLIGQGASASLEAIIGLTPPTGSLPLPATGGSQAILNASANNLVLASGNLVRGLDLNSTANIALSGASVGALSLSEMSVANSIGVAVNLANGTLAATLTSVSASGGANGIILQNTTGSFTVTGTGAAGSGGTIQNTVGANGSSAGNGVYLNSVSDVSLTSMNLQTHQNFAVRGLSVSNFALVKSTISGVNGNSAASDEGSVSFSGLTGVASITGCNISGGLEDNVRVVNASGTLNRLTIADTTIGANSTPSGNDGVFVEASSLATVNVTITNCSFTSARGDLLQLNALNTALMDWVVVDNDFANNHPNIVSGGGGTTFSGGGGGSAVIVTYDISDNTFRDALGIALNVFKGTGAGSFTGEITDNMIGVSGVANSGSSQASGLQITSSGTGTHTALIENNTIYQYNENGIYVRANDGGSQLNATILGNTVAQPAVFAQNGLQLNIGATGSDTCSACVDIQSNNLVGSGSAFDPDFNLRQRHSTTIRLPGYLGTSSDTTAVVTFVQGQNTGLPTGTATVSGSGSGFQGGSACAQPLLAMVEPATSVDLINSEPSSVRSGSEHDARAASIIALASETPVLDDASLNSIVAAAMERWQSTVLSDQQVAALTRVTFEVADLSGRHLGAATAGHVKLDRGGAGQGWFIDPTPMDETEFGTRVSETRLKSAAVNETAGRFDLLTAVMHELGHAAGLSDSYAVQARESLMYGFLPAGERRLPTLQLAAGAVPVHNDETHFIGAPIAISTLPPGKSITITFDATIKPPPPGGLCSVANQGVVSGSNFTDVLTDDPATGAADDPTVTVVNQPEIPVITPVPPTVVGGSVGNQASGPVGLAAYAWTISNGSITSGTNLQTITYTAGAAGNVTLGLTVFSIGGCSANNSILVTITVPPAVPPGCPFPTNFLVDTSFTDGLNGTTMTLAFDGTNYWSCSGGGTGGNRLARYDASGALLSTYAPGLDFRSVFTTSDGILMARAFNSPIIYRQVSPGVFTNSGVSLTGGTLDSQSSVVLNGDSTEYIAMESGTVSRWDTAGTHLGDVTLQGFGSVAGETAFGPSRGIAAAGAYWLTYNGSQTLSIWDASGNRLAQTTLVGAGTTFDSGFSLSYCNDKVWIVDAAGGTWRGYDVFISVRVAVLAAENNASWREDVRTKISGTGEILEVDVILVLSGEPVPTLADLSRYRAVLVFSDTSFNDDVAMGNVLADYVDQGGGITIATFAYHDVGSLGIKGRLKTGGYLPFSTASQASPGGLTLVKDLPSHPLLFDVTSFDGGTSSYHNSPIAITNGATLVASWSNGQPLVGAKQAGHGRVVGLNFFPPSSDARSDFWDASTDGSQLMINALLWTGQHPPLRFLTPGPAVGGIWPLYLENFDGTPIAACRVPYIQLYSTPDIAVPFSSWTLLTNPLVLTNGQIRVDGLDVTNAAGQLFRAVEVP